MNTSSIYMMNQEERFLTFSLYDSIALLVFLIQISKGIKSLIFTFNILHTSVTKLNTITSFYLFQYTMDK